MFGGIGDFFGDLVGGGSSSSGGGGGITQAVVDGGIDWFQAEEQNKANTRQAKDVMHFQQINSDTAYQRAAKDLRKAGINPILAGQFGGASSPAGAMATMGRSNAQPFTTAKGLKNVDSKTNLNNANRALSDAKKLLEDEKLPQARYDAIYPRTVMALVDAGKDMLDNPKALQSIKNAIQQIKKKAGNWNQFLNDIDKKVDKKILQTLGLFTPRVPKHNTINEQYLKRKYK